MCELQNQEFYVLHQRKFYTIFKFFVVQSKIVYSFTNKEEKKPTGRWQMINCLKLKEIKYTNNINKRNNITNDQKDGRAMLLFTKHALLTIFSSIVTIVRRSLLNQPFSLFL